MAKVTKRKIEKPQTFEVWAVVRGKDHLDWVYVGKDARAEAVSNLNRPAGERAVPATLTLTPKKRSRP